MICLRSHSLDRWSQDPISFPSKTSTRLCCRVCCSLGTFISSGSLATASRKREGNLLLSSGMATRKQGDTLPSCFSSHTTNKCPFGSLLGATFFLFLCSLYVILLFKMPPSMVLTCYLVLLSPRLRCALQSKYRIDTLPSGMSHCVADPEFKVN